MRVAWVLSLSRSYLWGLYALMESLRKYGHREDVHVLYYADIKQEALDKITEQEYDFKIEFYPLAKLREDYPVDARAPKPWDCRWYKYKYMSMIDYDIFCIWGGDVLLLNNISPYFLIAKEYIVLGGSRKTPHTQNPGELVEHYLATPMSDIPFITSDKQLLLGIFGEGQAAEYRMKCRGDIKCIYNTIIKQGKQEKMFLVSYAQWVHPWSLPNLRISGSNGAYYLRDGTRICSVEGPLWSKGFVEKKKHSEWWKSVKRLFHSEYNRAGKVYGLDA